MIATLALNPTIDVAYEVDHLVHTRKMRTRSERYAPGGGGINVARVMARLGSKVHALYLSGGATGPALDGLVAEHHIAATRIPIAGVTRMAVAAFECDTGREYRFTPQGPEVTEAEWHQALRVVGETDCRTMVLSGSLPQGVPSDFYAQAAERLHARGIDVVLDTSGEALRQGLSGAPVLLVKPSHGELAQLIGSRPETVAEITEAARSLVASGKARIVAVTMGDRGAVLAHGGGTRYLPAPRVPARSAVGAGDSFVAGMVHALSQGRDVDDAFCMGVAAGAAAVLSPGSGLAMPDDIARLHTQICAERA